jgi:hypothetical protein
MQSVMRLDEHNKSTQYICDCGKCDSGRFDIVYSMLHASVIGWRSQELPKKESRVFGRNTIILCPECAKNTEQANQPDSQ